jgi:hypothetical protein
MGQVYLFYFFSVNGPNMVTGPAFPILILLFNVGHWIYSEINPLCDRLPRCVCYFLLNYNLFQTSDPLWDSSMRINIYVCASILVLLYFIDSPVNRLTEIRAAGDWGHYFSIKQVL